MIIYIFIRVLINFKNVKHLSKSNYKNNDFFIKDLIINIINNVKTLLRPFLIILWKI